MNRNGAGRGGEAEIPFGPSSEREETASASVRVREGYRHLPLFGITAALVLLCVFLAVPFYPAITWSVALALIAWPLHRLVRSVVKWPGLAAGISTAIVVTVIVGCGIFVSYQLIQEGSSIAGQLNGTNGEGELRESVAGVPGASAFFTWLDQMGIDEARVREFLGSLAQDITSLASGSIGAVAQFLLTMFILFFLFRDRNEMLDGVRDLLPLTKQESEAVFTRAADSVDANLYATLVTAFIDAVSGGIVFWLVGIPAPMLWTVVMFVLSVIPAVGIALVWVPAVVYLGMQGQILGASAIVVWGLFCGAVIDNAFYSYLAGGRMRMHQALAMLSFLGGLAVFGMSGLVLGPAIVVVTQAFLEVWRHRLDAPSSTRMDEKRVLVQ